MKLTNSLVGVFFLVLLPAAAHGQCSFSAVETEPDDPRGFGLEIKVSGGDRNRASLTLTHQSGPWDFEHWSNRSKGEPVDVFYPFECINQPGSFWYELVMSCETPPATEGGEWLYGQEIVNGAFEVGDPATFEARVLSPPAPAGNVEVTYDFPPTSKEPVIYVPGVTEPVFVTGSGTVILDLPPGTHRIQASWCRTSGTERTKFLTVVVPFVDSRVEVEFDVPPSDRVLIGKYGPDAYPSPLRPRTVACS